jgi:hypothetical protein
MLWGTTVNGKVAVELELTAQKACKVDAWSCGFDRNWSSSDPTIGIQPTPCDKNAIMTQVISPTKRLTHWLVLVPTKAGQHRFRLAFRPGDGKQTLSSSPTLYLGVQ